MGVCCNQQLAAGTGGIMQVSGLHFTYTGTQGSGTITGVWLGAAGDNSTPIPDDGTQTYTGTANSFMIGGGDGFTVLESAGNIVQTADAELVPLVHYVQNLPRPVHLHDRRTDHHERVRTRPPSAGVLTIR